MQHQAVDLLSLVSAELTMNECNIYISLSSLYLSMRKEPNKILV